MSSHLSDLHRIELSLRRELEKISLFKQWESIKNSIALFNDGNAQMEIFPVDSIIVNAPKKIKIPMEYDENKLTWKEKILYVLSKDGQGSVDEIVTKLKELGEKVEDDSLKKRIGVTVSKMKLEDKIIDARMDGKKGVYYIK